MRCRLAGLLALLMSTSAGAQWLNHPDPTIPRLEDGKPNLSAAAPAHRTAGLISPECGRSSHRLPRRSSAFSPGTQPALRRWIPQSLVVKYRLNILADFKREEEADATRSRGPLPTTPSDARQGHPHVALSSGRHSVFSQIAPFKFVQTPRLIVMLLEDNNPPRQIYLDGRKLPVDPHPTFMGYSSGTWQGRYVGRRFGRLQRQNLARWIRPPAQRSASSGGAVQAARFRSHGRRGDEWTTRRCTRTFTIKFTARLLPDTDIFWSPCARRMKRTGVHLDR